MKILSSKNTYFILIFSAIFLPYSAFASTVYIDASHQNFFVGDTIMFSVRVDSENKNINTIEGTIMLDYPIESASLVSINTSNSEFSLWPGKPLPSEDNTSISFAGGTPLGLNSKDAIIFNIVLELQKEGQITLTPNYFSVYLHDGKGTKDTINVKNLVINVLPKKSDSQSVNDWNNLTLNDKTPPEPFEIYLGQEGSVFDGKKFLSFNTTDKQSGIDYYEVTEDGLPPVRSNGTYILQEQNKLVKATVVAYDLAGNERESIYEATVDLVDLEESEKYSYLNLMVIALGILLLVITLKFIFKRLKKNDLI